VVLGGLGFESKGVVLRVYFPNSIFYMVILNMCAFSIQIFFIRSHFLGSTQKVPGGVHSLPSDAWSVVVVF